MPMALNEPNLRQAYCKAIARTGIGAAEKDCDGVLPQTVKHVVPQPMQDAYPETLLVSLVHVCTHEPYSWLVTDEEPEIQDSTTFEDLWLSWVVQIVHA
jgi:hypothetical protein